MLYDGLEVRRTGQAKNTYDGLPVRRTVGQTTLGFD